MVADVVGHGDPFGVDGFAGDRHSEAGHYGAGLVSDGSASRAVSACAQAVTANARMARMRTEVRLNMAGSLQVGKQAGLDGTQKCGPSNPVGQGRSKAGSACCCIV